MELIVDNFAGGGGASLGLTMAGLRVDIAINHSKIAVDTHQRNHPETKHYHEDVWKVDPREATGGRPVGLAWFSPDCTHHSKARGGKPVKKKIRGLAWVVIRWAKLVKPRVIMLENVEEFQDWGPLTAEDRPDPARKGEEFQKWKAQLVKLGYQVEHRELRACDFGAPTTRKRFFLIARCDGRPIVWPEPTHGPARKLAWRTAAECIDWERPCPSIFLTTEDGKKVGAKRPLAENTMKRIARGLERYVINNPQPYIVRIGQTGSNGGNVSSINAPLTTVVTKQEHCLATPFISTYYGPKREDVECRGRSMDEPLPTAPTENRFGVVAPYLVKPNHKYEAFRGQDVERPLPTVTAAASDHALVSPFLVKPGHQGEGFRGQDIQEPLATVPASRREEALVAPVLVGAGGPVYGGKPAPIDAPMGTLLKENHRALCAPVLCGVGGRAGQSPPNGVDEPMRTTTAKADRAVVSAFMAKHYGGVVGHEIERPLGTVTSKDHHSVVAAFGSKFYGTSTGEQLDLPISTVSAQGNHQGLAAACLVNTANSKTTGRAPNVWDMEEPLRTITSSPGFARVQAFLLKYYGSNVGSDLLDPMHTVTSLPRFGLVTVEGEEYAIVDIGLRMLQPRELARAQGFPDSYVLLGTKAQQTALIGNSVPPQFAAALASANYSINREEAVA